MLGAIFPRAPLFLGGAIRGKVHLLMWVSANCRLTAQRLCIPNEGNDARPVALARQLQQTFTSRHASRPDPRCRSTGSRPQTRSGTTRRGLCRHLCRRPRPRIPSGRFTRWRASEHRMPSPARRTGWMTDFSCKSEDRDRCRTFMGSLCCGMPALYEVTRSTDEPVISKFIHISLENI